MTRDLLKEFPLTTNSNLRGQWFMLVWHTENTGNHIIVAKTKESIIKVWPTFIDMYDPDPKEFWEIVICDPGQKVHEDYAKLKFEEAQRDFRFQISQLLKNAKELKKATGEFVRCKKYVNKYADDPDFEMPDEYTEKMYRQRHYDCKNCIYEGFNHKTLTPEELFWAKKDVLLRKPVGFPLVEKLPDGSVRAMGTCPNPDTLYALEEDFGHHSKGLFIQPLAEHDAWHQTKFFFSGEPMAMPVEILKATVDARKKWEKAREESHRRYEAENNKYRKDNYNKLLEILK